MSLLIKGGLVVDGSGCPPVRADVLVEGTVITAVGPGLTGDSASIDADGLMVAPGFIDLHTHSDRTVFFSPAGNSKVMQGVTTEVTGNCGIGLFPVRGARKGELAHYIESTEGALPPGGIAWEDMDGFARAVAAVGPGLNIAPLVAHGALRIAALGSADRPASDQELADMKNMLATSLQQGAWGMSTGLIYPPGSFAGSGELTELAKVLKAYGAIFTSHVRGESGKLAAAVEEVIGIAAASGVRALVSHLKAIGQPNWGQGLAALARIEAARAAGLDLWADQYPYEATSTTLTALLPGWVQDGGPSAMLGRLVSLELQEKITAAVAAEMAVRGGPDRVRIASLRSETNRALVGLTIAEIAGQRGLAPATAAIELLLEEEGAVGAIYFSLSATDLEGIIKSDIVAVGSDGQGLDPVKSGRQMVHPRSYGTFPRVLGRYVREKGLLSWEAAVRKMTGLPATILGLPDRGFVRAGCRADLTLFDPARVIDKADFAAPHQYAEGIEHVLVNGTAAVKDGRLTGGGRGQVLRKTQ